MNGISENAKMQDFDPMSYMFKSTNDLSSLLNYIDLTLMDDEFNKIMIFIGMYDGISLRQLERLTKIPYSTLRRRVDQLHVKGWIDKKGGLHVPHLSTRNTIKMIAERLHFYRRYPLSLKTKSLNSESP
jgi:hypothetical protein